MVTETGAAPDPGSKEWNYGMAMQGEWILTQTISLAATLVVIFALAALAIYCKRRAPEAACNGAER